MRCDLFDGEDAMGGLLGDVDFWKVIGSAVGGALTAAASFFAYIVHMQRTFWTDRERTRREDLSDIVGQLQKERDDRKAQEAENLQLKKEVIELNEMRSEIIRQKIIEGERDALETISEINKYVEQLVAELDAKSKKIAELSEDNEENKKIIRILAAEISSHKELIGEMNSGVAALLDGISANVTINEKLEIAILDGTKPTRLLAGYKTRMANLKADALAKAAKAGYMARQAAKGQRERTQKAEAETRIERKAERQALAKMKMKRPLDGGD